MNPEVLENLLIDRALGQLSPDVQALLAEYLALHPGAAAAAADAGWEHTVSLAAAAFQSPGAAPALPPLKTTALAARRPLPWMAMAAAAAIGAGAALLAMRPTLPAPMPAAPVALQPAAPPTLARTQAAEPPSHEPLRAARSMPFWSKQRLYLAAAESRTRETTNE